MSNKISAKELIKELNRLNEIVDGSPTQEEMNKMGRYLMTPYYNTFGSWRNALEQAGLSQNKSQYTKEDLLHELHRLDEKFDHPPTQSDMRDHGKYHTTYYQREFGSWNEAKAEAGIETNHPGGEYVKVSIEELIDELNRLDKETNGPPTKKDMQKLGKYSHQIYQNRFESWNKALEEADLEKNRKVQEQTLLRELRRLDEELDRSPSQSDVDQYAKFSHRTYINKFGSFNIAKQEAGLETRKPGRAGSGQNHPSWKGGYEPYYGPSWHPARRAARERDQYECQQCGMTDQEHIERFDQELHVHHIRPLRTFEETAEANKLDNLITLCRSCHDKLEGDQLDL